MLPWHSHPYNTPAGVSEAGGGAEDLQTDVMRFMAMLGLCLVAIFALVQSLPATPPEPTASTAEATPIPAPPVAPPEPPPEPLVDNEAREALAPVRATEQPAPSQPRTVVPGPEPVRQVLVPAPTRRATSLSRSAPAAPAAAPPVSREVDEPLPPLAAPIGPVAPAEELRAEAKVPAPEVVPFEAPAVEQVPVDEAPVDEVPAEPHTPVFTLRFVDAGALMALVQRDAVSLFAVDGAGTSRLSAGPSRYAFEQASAPPQMHDMDPESVPSQVRSAYARTRGRSANAVRRWGVVLPAQTRRAIDELLRDPRGGELQITATGAVRLVPDPAAPPVTARHSVPLAKGAS